jgi:D-beta-D-heptose 7-phosphate kinase / D-beta-D-heptose 1-phosphate adenosyltransferase
MSDRDLLSLLGRIAGARLLVVGDVMLDRYVAGDISRISPEAPAPVLARKSEKSSPGGAANVAANLAALGARANLTGLVGRDSEAELLRGALNVAGLETGDLAVDAARPTTVKTRFVASGQQVLRVDREVRSPPAPEAEAHMVERIAAAGDVGAILISDYDKGVLTDAVLAACRDLARRTGAPVVIDPKRSRFADYGPASLIKPNAAELSRATGLPTESDADVERALLQALEGCAADAIMVTRGAQGLALARRGEPVSFHRAAPVEVFDVSGAGDTALAAVGAALAVGASLEEAARLSLAASRLAVTKAGSATVSTEELMRALGGLADREKILGHDAAAARVRAWREAGLKVGFTNGCFDLLHVGHIACLRQARRWCDRLVVAINSDESVRRLKGEGRPLNDEASRAEVLAALEMVDLVTSFADDTPLALITRLAPDVLVKGGDYKAENVVGADVVLARGGEVKIAQFVKDRSTTALARALTDRT